MTFTEKTMEWLGQNRHRAYPMQRDPWRNKVSADSGLDAVILDALLFDSDASGDEVLSLVSVEVSDDSTYVTMKYGETEFSLPPLQGGASSGEGSFSILRGVVRVPGSRGASMSVALSSHAYVLEKIGTGRWDLGCPVLPSRVVRLSHGHGVDGIATNGSSGVDGRDAPSVVSGDVVLEDGYRTSPIVYNGEILVRVGTRYGLDPCKYDFGDAGDRDCSRPLFFFCGQNAINSGNVVLKGGRGVSVSQGRSYTIKDRNSKCHGRSIPCVEIVAGRELLDIYSETSPASE